MFSAIYIESEVRDHPRSREILARYRGLPHIECERYGEIFNRKSQNFRLQKENPALILARKHGHKVLPAPGGYGFDATDSHYFSHMLNCVYDCRYCFPSRHVPAAPIAYSSSTTKTSLRPSSKPSNPAPTARSSTAATTATASHSSQ